MLFVFLYSFYLLFVCRNLYVFSESLVGPKGSSLSVKGYLKLLWYLT